MHQRKRYTTGQDMATAKGRHEKKSKDIITAANNSWLQMKNIIVQFGFRNVRQNITQSKAK